ncbi:outer membrane beta-barrel protein [Rufibacter sp. LB8]|uniref:outer membrane beta-barrel protein n=1 Tax=Rufibacter sp. LB8 TaxID=2777781 RepID=UPI00178C5834|nr:outer membrane beta-barrel protein [Rufibacter sp. LB8]
MKRLYALLSAIMMAAAIALPSVAKSNQPFRAAVQDTLILKLKNDAKVLVVVKDIKDIKSLKSQSLDSLMTILEKHIDQIERAGQGSGNQPVTVTLENKSTADKDIVTVTIQDRSKNETQVITQEKKKVRLKDIDIDIDRDTVNNKTTVRIDAGDNDTTSFEINKKKKPRYPKREFDFQLDLGVSQLRDQKMLSNNAAGAGAVDKVSLKPLGSIFWGLNFKSHYRLGGEESPLRLITGVTFDFHNFAFKDNVGMAIAPAADGTLQTVFRKESDISLDKSTYSTTTITVPLELSLHIKTSRNKTAFKIGGGGFVGYQFDGEYESKYSVGGNTRSVEVEQDFNQNHFQYGLSGFVGIRSLEVFAKYHLSKMFEKGQGPEAQAFAVGVRVLKF